MFSSTIEIEKEDLFKEFELAVLNFYSSLKFGRIGAYENKVIKLYSLTSQVPEHWSFLTKLYWGMLLEFWTLPEDFEEEQEDLLWELTQEDMNKIKDKVLNSFPDYSKYHFKYSVDNNKVNPISLERVI